MSISILGISFHLYGFILGLAAVLAFWLVEKKAQKINFPPRYVWRAGLLALIIGVIGARLWHVVTDYHLYQDNIWASLQIWQGGLSILGGLVGGLLGLYLASRIISEDKASPLFLADLAVFGLPLAQIVGRTANWVNGELYGLPTQLPWKIFIAPENRLSEFANTAYYHPLFFYEMVMMSVFLVWVWWYSRQQKRKIGGGFYLWSYLAYYSFGRFWLDFIRLDKALVLETILGVNQLVLAFVFTAILAFGLVKKYLTKQNFKLLAGAGLVLVWIFVWQGLQQTSAITKNQLPFQPAVNPLVENKQNSQLAQLKVNGQLLQVELAQTPEELQQGLSGRDQLLADGMLFIFPSKTSTSFWMKEMRFNLDIIWIADGQVVDITSNAAKPSPGTTLEDLPRYTPNQPVNMVLEVPAGQAAELNITNGSTVVLVNAP